MPSDERMWKRYAPPGRKSALRTVLGKPRGPSQRTIRSGSVQAFQTKSRGAFKMRVMTSTRPSGCTAALLFAGMFLLLLDFQFAHLQLAQILLQTIEALLPETAIVLQTVGGVLERTCLEPAGPPLRFAATRDQTGTLQHLEVLGD